MTTVHIASRRYYRCPLCDATVHPDPRCVIPGPDATVTCIGNGTAHIIVDPDLVLDANHSQGESDV